MPLYATTANRQQVERAASSRLFCAFLCAFGYLAISLAPNRTEAAKQARLLVYEVTARDCQGDRPSDRPSDHLGQAFLVNDFRRPSTLSASPPDPGAPLLLVTALHVVHRCSRFAFRQAGAPGSSRRLDVDIRGPSEASEIWAWPGYDLAAFVIQREGDKRQLLGEPSEPLLPATLQRLGVGDVDVDGEAPPERSTADLCCTSQDKESATAGSVRDINYSNAGDKLAHLRRSAKYNRPGFRWSMADTAWLINYDGLTAPGLSGGPITRADAPTRVVGMHLAALSGNMWGLLFSKIPPEVKQYRAQMVSRFAQDAPNTLRDVLSCRSDVVCNQIKLTSNDPGWPAQFKYLTYSESAELETQERSQPLRTGVSVSAIYDYAFADGLDRVHRGQLRVGWSRELAGAPAEQNRFAFGLGLAAGLLVGSQLQPIWAPDNRTLLDANQGAVLGGYAEAFARFSILRRSAVALPLELGVQGGGYSPVGGSAAQPGGLLALPVRLRLGPQLVGTGHLHLIGAVIGLTALWQWFEDIRYSGVGGMLDRGPMRDHFAVSVGGGLSYELFSS